MGHGGPVRHDVNHSRNQCFASAPIRVSAMIFLADTQIEAEDRTCLQWPSLYTLNVLGQSIASTLFLSSFSDISFT